MKLSRIVRDLLLVVTGSLVTFAWAFALVKIRRRQTEKRMVRQVEQYLRHPSHRKDL